jgi:hypothetical protein
MALAHPAIGKAKKHKKKKKSKNGCSQQTQQCIDVATPLCADATDPTECDAGVRQCCQLAGVCEPLLAVMCAQSFFLV